MQSYPSCGFNPRSPWEERPKRLRRNDNSRPFQSTLPVGGATKTVEAERQLQAVSIHAPRGRSDLPDQSNDSMADQFQSTLPVGGATTDGPI